MLAIVFRKTTIHDILTSPFLLFCRTRPETRRVVSRNKFRARRSPQYCITCRLSPHHHSQSIGLDQIFDSLSLVCPCTIQPCFIEALSLSLILSNFFYFWLDRGRTARVYAVLGVLSMLAYTYHHIVVVSTDAADVALKRSQR